MIAALLQHPRDNRFLANVALGDVLDCHPRLGGQRCRALSHTVSQRHRELRVVEDADRHWH